MTSARADGGPATDPSGETLALLRAVQELGAADDPRDLLARSVRLACLLTGAGCGVLALVDEDRPDRFTFALTHGPDGDAAAALLDGSPGDAALGADVLLGGSRYAVLRLAQLPSPGATRHRVALDAVAAATGARVETLRERQVSLLHEQVARTVWELDATLVGAVDLEVSLPLLVDRTRELSQAQAVALVGRAPEGGQRVLAAAGDVVPAALAEMATDIDEALVTGAPRHWSTLSPDRPLAAGVRRQVTSLVPLQPRAGDPVVLALHRWTPPEGVAQQQVQDIVSALALHASLILDREHAEREHDLVTLLEDRDRIARDLHDLVIQRLFAVGLTLQGTSRRAGSPEVVERLESAVGELDQTIRDIRATIFELRHRPGEGSFRANLRALVDSYAPTLGFAPVLQVSGPLDSVADEEVHSQVLMVVREALSNVARHARATGVQVLAEATGEQLSLTVRDDGVGLPADAVESGLSNVRARARERGGEVTLAPVQPHGTHLRWTVPLP